MISNSKALLPSAAGSRPNFSKFIWGPLIVSNPSNLNSSSSYPLKISWCTPNHNPTSRPKTLPVIVLPSRSSLAPGVRPIAKCTLRTNKANSKMQCVKITKANLDNRHFCHRIRKGPNYKVYCKRWNKWIRSPKLINKMNSKRRTIMNCMKIRMEVAECFRAGQGWQGWQGGTKNRKYLAKTLHSDNIIRQAMALPSKWSVISQHTSDTTRPNVTKKSSKHQRAKCKRS